MKLYYPTELSKVDLIIVDGLKEKVRLYANKTNAIHFATRVFGLYNSAIVEIDFDSMLRDDFKYTQEGQEYFLDIVPSIYMNKNYWKQSRVKYEE